MKLSYPGIRHVFDTDCECINSIVIENRQLLCELICDIKAQIGGEEGISVISDNGNIVNVKKHVEVIDQFVPFSVNKKAFLGKIQSHLLEISQSNENYVRANEILNEIERFLDTLMVESKFNLEYVNLSMDMLFKSVGLKVSEDYSCISDALLNYFDLVNSLEGEKLFVLVNLRSYITNYEAQLLFNELISRKISVILIESYETERLINEIKYVVDASLCEIYE